MRALRYVVAVVLILVGALWIAQGSGFLKGSFMTGRSVWLIVGIVSAVLGLGLLLVTFRTAP